MGPKEIIQMIREGEGETLEFKTNSHGVAETACAFANSYGGTIVIGITDDGEIRGVTQKEEERITSVLHGISPSPNVSIQKVEIDTKRLLVIKIDRMDSLTSIGATSYIRVGRGNRPLSIDELIQRAIQIGRIQFDLCPSTAPVSELDQSYLRKYLSDRKKMRGINKRGSLKENLHRLKISVKKDGATYLSYGGLLFFTKNPQEHLPSSGVRVIFQTIDGETISVKEFSGPIWKMANDSIDFVLSRLNNVNLRIGAARRAILEYPEGAVREAVINAVAHRNYAVDSDIRIFIRPDGLIVRSPGSFPQGVTVQHPEHKPVNPLISQFLYDIGMIERYGFGITKMFSEVKHHPYCELCIEVVPARVDVIFKKKLKGGPDDSDQKIIALLQDGPVTSTVIARELGLSKPTTIGKLKQLIGMGLISSTGKGPATRYSIKKKIEDDE